MTRVFVSVSETDEEGLSATLFTSNGWSSEEFPPHEAGSLEGFLMQMVEALVKALSMDEDGPIFTALARESIDGGWGGAGQTTTGERSEVDHA